MLLIRCVPLSVRIAALLLFVLRTLQTKNPTASLACLPWGMLSYPLSDRYGSSSPPGF